MKTLFLRVLALVLGCSLLVVLVSFLTFKWISDELEPGSGYVRSVIHRTAEQVVSGYLDGDLDKTRKRLKHRRARAWIEDDLGTSLTKRPVPPEIRSQIRTFPQIIHPDQNTAGRFFIFTEAVERDDRTFHVILTARRSGFHRHDRFGFFWVPLVGILILGLVVGSAAISYWILRPLRAFRDTAGSIHADTLGTRLPARISDRKDAFGDLAREFNEMTGRLEKSAQNQNQLLRDVSHELRSPLARIQVAASLWARKTGETEEARRIENEVDRLDRMIGDLLSLSRLKSGIPLDLRTLDLVLLVRDVSDDAVFEFSPEGKTVSLTGLETAPGTGDATLLSSAFENVVRNALRHSPVGGDISIEFQRAGGNHVINVRDHGPGVDPERLESIFEPFYRIDEARDIDNGHHGIGLALVKAIVELHRGTVEARNESTGGLCMIITLPVDG